MVRKGRERGRGGREEGEGRVNREGEKEERGGEGKRELEDGVRCCLQQLQLLRGINGDHGTVNIK